MQIIHNAFMIFLDFFSTRMSHSWVAASAICLEPHLQLYLMCGRIGGTNMSRAFLAIMQPWGT